MPESVFERRVRERREQREREAAVAQVETPVVPEKDLDLIPSDETGRSESDREMDALIERIGIIEAYNKWNLKGFVAKPRPGQTEGIKVRCPFPDHEDKRPDAWIGLNPPTLCCGPCGNKGADKYDLAALRFGYPLETYKQGENFHNLRREMVVDMGLAVGFQKVGKDLHPIQAEESKTAEPADDTKMTDLPSVVAATPTVTTVNAPVEDDEDDNLNDQLLSLLPPVPWQDFAADGTWLHQWMDITTQDDVPNEYHFGHGLLALSMVGGGQTRLCEKDYVDEYIIPSNLFICLLGKPAAGKSKSKKHLVRLIQDNLKYGVDQNAGNNWGVKLMGEPASGEVLIRKFSEPWYNPTSSSKTPEFYMSVNGLVEFDELEALMKRIKRDGSTLRTSLIQIYDCASSMKSDAVTTGDKEAHNPFGSVLTTTQPRSLPRLLSNEDAGSGFLSRWLFLPGKPKPQIHFGGANIDVTPTYPEFQKIKGWASQFNLNKPIGMDTDARRMAFEFFQDTLLKDRDRDQRDILRRVDFLFKKMILLCAINERCKVVSTEQIERCIKLYPYLLATFGVSSDTVGNTEYDEIKNAILSVLAKQRSKGKVLLTKRDFDRSLAKRKYPDEAFLKALKLLIEQQYIDKIETPTGTLGRKTVKYRLVTDD